MRRLSNDKITDIVNAASEYNDVNSAIVSIAATNIVIIELLQRIIDQRKMEDKYEP